METGIPDLPAAVKDKFPIRRPGACTGILDQPFFPENLTARDNGSGGISGLTEQLEIHGTSRTIRLTDQGAARAAGEFDAARGCVCFRHNGCDNTLYQLIYG